MHEKAEKTFYSFFFLGAFVLIYILFSRNYYQLAHGKNIAQIMAKSITIMLQRRSHVGRFHLNWLKSRIELLKMSKLMVFSKALQIF